MKTLQERALLEQTKHIETLEELLAFCESDPAITNSCIKSGEFWKESLIRFFGDILVLQRGDIEGDLWYDFAKLLATGVEYVYTIRVYYDPEDFTKKVKPYYLVKNDYDEERFEMDHKIFRIAASVPKSGTKGYFIQIYIYSPDQRFDETSFFVGGDQNKIFEMTLEFAVKTWINIHKTKITYDHKVKFVYDRDLENDPYDELYAIRKGELKAFPTKDEILDLFKTVEFEENGEFFSGTFFISWPRERNFQKTIVNSEFNFYIYPIEF